MLVENLITIMYDSGFDHRTLIRCVIGNLASVCKKGYVVCGPWCHL